MRSTVARDLSDSARDFVDIVWPIAAKWCGGGGVLPVESTADDDLRGALDRLSGIDAWQVCDDQGRMRGIASRIQWEACYRSFTIRESRGGNESTELQKRIEAMDSRGDWLLPSLTIQAYLRGRGGPPRFIACCYTRDLYNYVSMYRESEVRSRTNNQEEGRPVKFLVAWVHKMAEHGINVKTYSAADVERYFALVDAPERRKRDAR